MLFKDIDTLLRVRLERRNVAVVRILSAAEDVYV